MRRFAAVPYFIIDHTSDIYEHLLRVHEIKTNNITHEILRDYPRNGVRKIQKVVYEETRCPKSDVRITKGATCLVVDLENLNEPLIYLVFVPEEYDIEKLQELGYLVDKKGKIVNAKDEKITLPFTPEEAEKILIGYFLPEDTLNVYFT